MQRWLFILCCVFTSYSLASETLNYSIHHHYITPRALGMGNTFMGIDDYNLVLYNPAGLARLEEGELNFALQGGTSFETLDFISDVGDASDTQGTDADKMNAINAVLQNNYGKTLGFRFPNLQAFWARPGWGIAIIPLDLTATLIPHNIGLPAVDVTAYQDTTIAFGKGWSFGKYFSAGATLKAIYRGNVDRSILSSELITNSEVISNDDLKEGLTVDLDLGVLYTPPVPEEGMWKWFKYAVPTFGLVVRNAGDYGYFKSFNLMSKQPGEPSKLERRIDVGTKWLLPEFWVFKPQLLVEQRDILHSNYTFMKGLHVGAELLWKVSGWLQGAYQVGLSQGYLTAGIGAQLAWFRLDLATYSNEVGTSDASKEDRQYIAKLNLNF